MIYVGSILGSIVQHAINTTVKKHEFSISANDNIMKAWIYLVFFDTFDTP